MSEKPVMERVRSVMLKHYQKTIREVKWHTVPHIITYNLPLFHLGTVSAGHILFANPPRVAYNSLYISV